MPASDPRRRRRGASCLLTAAVAMAVAIGGPGAERAAATETPHPPAGGDEASRVPAGLVADLLAWIGTHSDYDTAGVGLPEIRFCNCGDVVAYEGREVEVADGLIGMYDAAAGRIFLVEPWDPAEPRDVSDLLHELVHHVQLQRRDWPCLQRTEWDAYKLQETWLRQQGVEPAFNWVLISILSSCAAWDVHPGTGGDRSSPSLPPDRAGRRHATGSQLGSPAP